MSQTGHREVRSCRVLTGAYQLKSQPSQKQKVLKAAHILKKESGTRRKLERPIAVTNKSKSMRVLPSMESFKPCQPKPRRSVQKVKMEVEDLGRRAQNQKITFLEMKSISSEVQHQYHQYQSKFASFCWASGLGWPLSQDTDAVLADFLDVMFLEGKSAAEGEKVVASIEFHNINLKGSLVRAQRALRGWRKERPPQSRLPLPRLIASGMAMILMGEGKKLMALKLMVDHDTYLRPGESIELKGRDVVAPVKNSGKQYRWYSIVGRDSEDLKPDKVGVFDNTIPLNSPGREFLGELIWKRAKSLNSKEELIYPFTSAEYRKNFQRVGEGFNLKNLHPYQTRYGGASEDLNSGDRCHQGVKRRGRWHTDQSVRRYAKVGKVQRLMGTLSPEHMEFCQWSLKNMEKVLKGLITPRVL